MNETGRGISRLARLWERTPRWTRLVIATVALVVGIAVLLRPTASLGLLALLIGAGLVVQGVVELADSAGRHAGESRFALLTTAVSALWVAAGVFVLVFPGLTVGLIAVIVGVGLVVSGVLSAARVFRRRRTVDARIADGAFGVASVVFGVLALAWPDVTLLVVSVVFGARLIIGALSVAWRTLRPRPTTNATQPGPFRRWARTGVAILTVAASVALGLASGALHGGTVPVDDFYASPRTVPDGPGHLIRSEPFTRGVPADARAWRILYTTTRGDGSPATASGLVVVPRSGSGSWPLIAWDHGTTGYARTCAPSLLDQPFESGALFVLPDVIEQGWALVATDYIGLGTPGPHPYLIGKDSAYASLDAVRASRELRQADVGTKTVAWGHSQGGGAALWTGAVAERYAPDVSLSGVAALAPAANLPSLVEHLPDVTGGSIFASFAVAAYTADYPDVTYRRYVHPGAEPIVRAMAGRCLSNTDALVSVLDAVGLGADPRIFAQDPTTGPFGARLEENVPPATVTVPTLVAQGAADTLVVPSAQAAYVRQACAAGESIDYRTFEGLDHVPLVEADSPLVPQLVRWTTDRFDAKPAAPGCTTRTF